MREDNVPEVALTPDTTVMQLMDLMGRQALEGLDEKVTLKEAIGVETHKNGGFSDVEIQELMQLMNRNPRLLPRMLSSIEMAARATASIKNSRNKGEEPDQTIVQVHRKAMRAIWGTRLLMTRELEQESKQPGGELLPTAEPQRESPGSTMMRVGIAVIVLSLAAPFIGALVAGATSVAALTTFVASVGGIASLAASGTALIAGGAMVTGGLVAKHRHASILQEEHIALGTRPEAVEPDKGSSAMLAAAPSMERAPFAATMSKQESFQGVVRPNTPEGMEPGGRG